MKDKSKCSRLKINNLIIRSFVFSIFVIVIIACMCSLYFSEINSQSQRINNSKKIHEILLNLIAPALNISDVNEIRRLLMTASSKNETFIVIDDAGNILMSDYTKLKLIKFLIKDNKSLPNCDNWKNTFQLINNNKYWINCTSILRNDVLSQEKRLGELFSFSKKIDLVFSPILFFLIGLSLFVVLFLSIWFRQILHRRLLCPLIILGSRIMEKIGENVIKDTSLGDIGNAPYEVFYIKSSFENLLLNLQNEYKHRIESEKKELLFDLAARLAHDICSPLTVMEISLKSNTQYIPKAEVDLQKEAIQCIRNITNDLLNRYRTPHKLIEDNNLSLESPNQALIFMHILIELVISQKRQEWKSNPCEINFSIMGDDTQCICIKAFSDDIKRMLSNLLNNSYEALKVHNRRINITLEFNQIKNQLILIIQDWGNGIPEDKIHSVLNGKSSKHSGKGLGLSSALYLMQQQAGQLQLESQHRVSTKVTLIFNQPIVPKWLPKEIQLFTCQDIVILDNDQFIYKLLHHKLIGSKCNIHSFTQSLELYTWIKNNHKRLYRTIFLIDYETNNKFFNGLELLTQLQVAGRGYLITSHLSEDVHNKITASGLWLIPKELLQYISIAYHT